MSTKRIAVIVGLTLLVAGVAGGAVWQRRRSRPPSQKTVADGRPELVLQTGHPDRVTSIAFSPDSSLIASFSKDGTVKLWDVARRRELRSFFAPSTNPSKLAFSRDGQRLTASGDQFQEWSVATGRSANADLHLNWEAGTAEGRWRARRTDSGISVSQEAALGGATHELPRLQPNTSLTPVFSADGRWLAIREDQVPPGITDLSVATIRATALRDSVESTTRVFELGTWRLAATIPGRRPFSDDLAFSHDGKHVAVIADGRRQVEIWDTAAGKQERVLRTPMPVSVIMFSPDSRVFLTGAGSYLERMRGLANWAGENPTSSTDQDGSLMLWDLATDAPPRNVNAGSGVESVVFSADSRRLGVAGVHGVVYWDLHDASIRPVIVESGKSTSVAFSADNQRIAWAVKNGVKVGDLASGTSNVVTSTPLMPVDSAALSPDGHWLAAFNKDWSWLAAFNEDFQGEVSGRVRIWDIGMGREAHTLASDAPAVESMAFSPDGRRLVTLGDRMEAWDTSSGQAIRPPETLGTEPMHRLMSVDGRTVVSWPDDANLLTIESAQSVERIVSDGPVEYATLSANGRWLAVSGCYYTKTALTGCRMQLWDVTTRKELRAADENVVRLAISPDGRWLAGAGGAGRPALMVWDNASGTQQLALGKHLFSEVGIVNAIAFSPDSRLIAFSNDMHAIEIWDIATKKQIGHLAGHTGAVGHIEFMPDGRVLSTSFDGTIRLWNPAANELLLTMVFMRDQKQWLAITPSGLFDGSPDAWTHLLWRFHGNTFDVTPVDTFVNEFYHPGLIGEVFSGQRPVPPRDIAQIDRRQTAVRLDAEPIDARMTRVRVTIDDTAAAGGPTGAQDVRLFRNGSLVKTWRGNVLPWRKHQVALVADVPIVSGENRFSAYAFNRDNIKSEDAVLTVNGAGPPRKGTAHVIAIGLNNYANATFNLKFAAADAMRFAEQFKAEQEKIGRFDRVEVVPLLNEDATKANILRTLNGLAAEPEDGVFIFFAGHGVAEGDRFYFVPHDLGFAGAREALGTAGVRAITAHSISDLELERALESVDAAQLLLVIDACNSGQALEAEEKRQGPMNSKGLAQLAYEKGMYVLTAAQSYQAAMETARLGHGLLTYALVEEGLAAREADVAPNDGTILMREWLDFAAEKVPTLQLDLLKDTRSPKLATVPVKTAPDLPNVQRPRVFYRRELDLQPLVVARR